MRLQEMLLMYTFDKMASARPIMELWFFCFVSHHSFCPVTNHVSGEHCRDVCGCLSLILSRYSGNQHTVCNTCHWDSIASASAVVLPIRDLYNFTHKFQVLQKYIYITQIVTLLALLLVGGGGRRYRERGTRERERKRRAALLSGQSTQLWNMVLYMPSNLRFHLHAVNQPTKYHHTWWLKG